LKLLDTTVLIDIDRGGSEVLVGHIMQKDSYYQQIAVHMQ